MRGLRITTALAMMAFALAGSANVAPASEEVVEVGVAFSVLNTNTSRTAATCTPDGRPYTIRGTLAAPASLFEDGPADAVTLYFHGSGDGSSWNFAGFPGMNHIVEMAALGHTSVYMHMLGYGTSDPIDGNAMCTGSWADVGHQVVQRLRAGTYAMDDARPAPEFERVALVGHSGGGIAAALYSVSYTDIDALVIAGWTEFLPTYLPLFTRAAGLGAACATGGRSKTPGGPAGWARLFSNDELGEILYNVDPDVLEAFRARYEDDYCGLLKDAGPAMASNVTLSPLVVDIPVLAIYGDHDPFLPGSFDVMRSRYLSSDDVSLAVMPDAGHNPMMGRTAAAYRAVLSAWLKARGF